MDEMFKELCEMMAAKASVEVHIKLQDDGSIKTEVKGNKPGLIGAFGALAGAIFSTCKTEEERVMMIRLMESAIRAAKDMRHETENIVKLN